MTATRRAAAGLLAVAVLVGAEAAQVDAATFSGYRRYHAVCSHCGPAGLGGSFAPGLLERTRGAAAFRTAVLDGARNGLSAMQGYAGDPNVAPFVADLAAYRAARRDGALGPGRPQRLP